MDIFSQDREQLLSNIVETAPFPIGVYTGTELKIEMANATMIATYAKGPDVVGKSYAEILPELENQQIFEQLRGVLATGIPFHATNQRVDIEVGGVLTPHYFNYSFTPIYDSNGHIYGVMNTAANVTELNVAKQKVTEAEGKLLLAIESANLATYETNLLTNELVTSPRFNEILGLQPPIMRSHIVESLHPEDRPVRQAAHEKALAGDGNVSYDARVPNEDGTEHWIRVNGKIYYDDDHQPKNLLGIVQDITEQREAAAHLQELVKRRTEDLQRSNEDLQQFAHVVSHDLKEPVRKISIFTKLLHEIIDSDPAAGKKHVEKIKNASDRLAGLIEGILRYSSISASHQAIEKIDLNKTFETIFVDLEVPIGQKNAKIDIPELPTIDGVPVMIYQLFYNLVNNALKFTRDGVAPELTISWAPVQTAKNDYAHIKLADNGIGIAPEYRQKIFTAFERLNAKDKYEGTGLGLALCKKIVERHHGTIEIEHSDEGALFVVCLPFSQWDQTIG